MKIEALLEQYYIRMIIYAPRHHTRKFSGTTLFLPGIPEHDLNIFSSNLLFQTEGQEYLYPILFMQLAIRRVVPPARQILSVPSSTRLMPGAVRIPGCYFSHAQLCLKNRGCGRIPLLEDSTKLPRGESVEDAVEKEAGVNLPPEVEEENSFIPEVSHEEMIGGVLGTPGGVGGDSADDRPTTRRGRPTGSKGRVIRKSKDISKPVIPEWFIDRGVVLREENIPEELGPPLRIYSDFQEPAEPETLSSDSNDLAPVANVENKFTEGRYLLHEFVWNEITAHIRTGLLLPKGSFADGLASTKSHCLLHMPKEGGLYFLDAIAKLAAKEVGADLVRMDAQDFAEIAGDFLGDSRHETGSDISPSGIRFLSYDAQTSLNHLECADDEEYTEISDETYGEEDNMESTQPPYLPSIRIGPLPITSFSNILPTHWPRILRFGRILQPTEGEQSFSAMQSKELIQDRLNERKLASILEAMVSAGQEKRSRQRLSNSTPDDGGAAPRSASDKTIIQIRDYRELERTPSGRALLKMLHNIVQDRRREGERITILGTTSNEAPQSLYTKNGVRVLQSRSDESLERTIVVPPLFSEAELKVLNNDKAARNREVNIRHLRDVIRRRDGEEGGPAILSVPDGWHFSDEEPRISEIEVGPWSFDRVHRVATVALGALTSARKEISIRDIMAAVNLINESDQIKVSWALQEKEYLKKRDEVANNETNGEGTGSGKAKPIPKNLTTHEKKLVAGIIDPMNIHTGFSAVCAPSETIEAMKTLTSLSLIRPEAFKYGVLATDRIPGVLLYGPPGTGKTLLARAVAKESGATVLEVSGGDIFNMYVGEGEKNVKAIFSLAKKLSPCVIFIDEADAIFGSRQSFSNRSSHREIINQFLKEWADMDSTAFIMIATNRPFDLDDAVLRRLPRRILIDLPTPGERLKILQIHLANEILDETVILKEIADSGALYSGSDLKNLCVSAALNCVKDENAEFEKTGSYPDKRILKKHHFEKAMNEITASISDDMGSLGMIRKFDDKYGERAGRKKTKRTWGFEVGQTSQSHSEGRVRVD